MRISIRSSHHNNIRSEQAGDWNYSDSGIFVDVLEDLPPHSQLAIAIHELVEAYLCREHGISDLVVCEFDDKYEAERKEGKHGPAEEPGDDPSAPYLKEHRAATRVEREVCKALGLSWKEHEQSLLDWEADHQKTAIPDPSPPESSEPPPQHGLD